MYCNANSARWQQEDYVPTGPASRGGQETYLAAFDNNLDLDWTTWYGGAAIELDASVTYDAYTDELHIGGGTSSQDIAPIPLKPLPYANAYFQGSQNGAQSAGYLARFPAISNWALSNKEAEKSPNKHSWQLMPNPAEDFVNIVNPYKETACSILAADGREVLTIELQAGENHVGLSKLPQGIYLIRLSYHDVHEIHKLVVQ